MNLLRNFRLKTQSANDINLNSGLRFRKKIKTKKKKIFDLYRIYYKIVKGCEQVITVFVVGIVLMALWFLYLIFGTWSPAKFMAGINQNEEIKLPGNNVYDEKLPKE